MQVLIADKLPATASRTLEDYGFDVSEDPSLSGDALSQALSRGVDVLVVRSTRVSAEMISGAPSLQLIVRAGAGYDTIDWRAASDVAVYVANCPGQNSVAVAELAMGLLIALDRRFPDATAELRDGHWNKAEYARARGLQGRTLGIVGIGQIGREVARRAKAFGLDVVGWSRSFDEAVAAALGVGHAEDLLELARRCDAISIHVASTPETRGLLSTQFFEAVPEQALIVNTLRGGVVDEEAILAALDERGLRYGTDVFEGEPASKDVAWEHPLALHPRTICTPHIGASTQQAQRAVADETVRVIEAFHRTGKVPNCVNLCARSQSRWSLNVRHLNTVGVLANVLSAIREAGINVEDVENVIFDGMVAACARMSLSREPDTELVNRIESFERVLGVELIEEA